MSTKPRWFKEGDEVLTAKGEAATIYMLHPTAPVCVLIMAGQYMPDGGQALRMVPVDSITRADT